jgi:predicted TIM-barrel fold metal-dependent hydrolase
MKLPQLEKLYQFASDHGLPITVHTGRSMFPGARNKYGDPLYLDDVLTDFPKLRLIMAHGGGRSGSTGPSSCSDVSKTSTSKYPAYRPRESYTTSRG